jgi:hypothetical protein
MRQMASAVWGVLVADVVNSSAVPRLRSVLEAGLRTANREHRERLKLPYSVTAGDEFQAVALRLTELPGLIFDLRRRLRPLRLRMGVGIGEVEGRLRPPVNQLAGEAFRFAREAIDEVKNRTAHKYEVLTAFRSRNESFDGVANLVYGLHDTLLTQVSAKQWRTIDAYLAQKRVEGAARALRVSVSTASRNLKRGYFWQISETLESMRRILKSGFR